MFNRTITMRELRLKAGEIVNEMKFGEAIQITQYKQNVKVLITQDYYLHLVGKQSDQNPPLVEEQPLVEKRVLAMVNQAKANAVEERVKITDLRYKVEDERGEEVDIKILLEKGDKSKGIPDRILEKTITFGVYCMIKNAHEKLLNCVGDLSEENICPYGMTNKIFT